MQERNVPQHVAAIGRQFKEGLATIAEQHGVPLKIAGHDALVSIAFAFPYALALQTLFTVRMLDRGFLAAAGFYPSLCIARMWKGSSTALIWYFAS